MYVLIEDLSKMHYCEDCTNHGCVNRGPPVVKVFCLVALVLIGLSPNCNDSSTYFIRDQPNSYLSKVEILAILNSEINLMKEGEFKGGDYLQLKQMGTIIRCLSCYATQEEHFFLKTQKTMNERIVFYLYYHIKVQFCTRKPNKNGYHSKLQNHQITQE